MSAGHHEQPEQFAATGLRLLAELPFLRRKER